MARLIDADAFREFWNKNYRHQYANDNFLIAIANFPTVDAVPVLHGRWIARNKGQNNWVECSECNTIGSPFWKCCPVCTAMMDGGDHDE